MAGASTAVTAPASSESSAGIGGDGGGGGLLDDMLDMLDDLERRAYRGAKAQSEALTRSSLSRWALIQSVGSHYARWGSTISRPVGLRLNKQEIP